MQNEPKANRRPFIIFVSPDSDGEYRWVPGFQDSLAKDTRVIEWDRLREGEKWLPYQLGFYIQIIRLARVVRCPGLVKWIHLQFFPFERFGFVKMINETVNRLLITAAVIASGGQSVLLLPAGTDPDDLPVRPLGSSLLYIRDSDPYDGSFLDEHVLKRSTFIATYVKQTPHLLGYRNKIRVVSQGFFPEEFIRPCVMRESDPGTVLMVSWMDWRIDFDLLDAVVKLLRNRRFYIVSPAGRLKHRDIAFRLLDRAAQTNISRLLTHRNVKHIVQENLMHALNGLPRPSVGIIPYRTDYRCLRRPLPLPLPVYAALDIPVVSSGLESVRRLHKPYITCADNHGLFADAIRNYSDRTISPSQSNGYRNIAAAHTFEREISEIFDTVNDNPVKFAGGT